MDSHETRNPPDTSDGGHRIVFCVKLQRDLPALDEIPWPGELGERIYKNVSAAAWRMWEDRMRMLLNEYRLRPWEQEAQELMARLMEDFFFNERSQALPENNPPQPE
jgi:Fe-S cluster biosynthesis and repair protein YggX